MKKISPFIAFFICLSVFPQAKPTNGQELMEKYSDYFALDREAVYLHLNKTKTVPGESLWFSAYAFLPKFLLPAYQTTNLHVNLYDGDGKLMEAKTVYLQNGVGSGYFELDSLYAPGKYLLRASTKYMKNFLEDAAFEQSFTILGTEGLPSKPREYDLQLLPEGGHFVAGEDNTVGVKLIDNSGKGVFFSDGKVMNGKGEIITTFKSNSFGLSKFRLTPTIGEVYTAVLTTGYGDEIKKELPSTEPMGMTLTANSLLPDEMAFSLNINQASAKLVQGKTFFLAIHKDGEMRLVEFIFPSTSTETVLRIPNKTFYPGINTVTVFDQNLEPVLERLVFHWKGIKRKQVDAIYKKRFMDSLFIGLNSPDSLGLHSLSISVLPSGTKAYKPRNNSLSAFYIEPYIKGNLENGGYYFSRKTDLRRRDYDLDLLLLTQGWSKYEWNNIFRNTPRELHQPETGFTISGQISDRNEKKETQVFLKSQENKLFAMVELNENGSFKLENVFIEDSTSIAFGLINERNNKTSKSQVYMRVFPPKDESGMPDINLQNFQLFSAGKKDVEGDLSIPADFIKDAVNLQRIFLEARMEEETEEPDYTGMGARRILVDEQLANSYFYIIDLIRFRGFRVTRDATGVSIYSTRGSTIRGQLSATVYLDGMRLGRDNHLLRHLKTRDVESIYINKTGAGFGLGGAGGVIHIQTKKGYYSGGKARETITSKITENGFGKQKKFYAPKYRSYNSAAFEKFGAIGWFPDIILDKGKAEIKIWNTGQRELKLFVEGIAADGGLISEEIMIKVE